MSCSWSVVVLMALIVKSWKLGPVARKWSRAEGARQVGRSRNSDEVVFWVQEMLPSRKKRGEVARLQAETSAAWLAPWKRAIGRLLVVKKIHRATSDTRGNHSVPKASIQAGTPNFLLVIAWGQPLERLSRCFEPRRD